MENRKKRNMDFSGIVSRVHRSGRETREKERHNCFISHETGLDGRLIASVSQAETMHLCFFQKISPGSRFNFASRSRWP